MKSVAIVSAVIFLAFNLYAQQPTDRLKTEAVEQMKYGRYGEAIDLLNRFISAEPQNPEGYNLRGLCYEHRKRYEMAVYNFRSALKLNPKNIDYNSNLQRAIDAWTDLLLNNIIGYKREIAINTAIPINYLEIGKCYKNLGEWQKAEDWYDEYLKRKEASADEIIRYSEILAKNNHISKGEPILKRYTEKYPEDHRLWSRYGYFTMWLGKKQVALKAFKTALELRPYFKEALDGYDLVRGKGYIYTVNDTTSRYNYGLPVRKKYKEYPIDKYYRILKSKPNDFNIRYLLISELLKNNRHQEAFDQMKLFLQTKTDNNNFIDLRDKILAEQEKYFSEKIAELENTYKSNQNDGKTLLELAKYLSYQQEYNTALSLLQEYLNRFPGDSDARYQYALISLWNKDLLTAKEQVGILLDRSPGNSDYNLLFAQLCVWMNEDLNEAEISLNKVLKNDPDNFQALLTLASLYFQQNKLADAQTYLNKTILLQPESTDIKKLQYSIDLQKERNKDAQLYNILLMARENVFNKNCDDAIYYFKEYLLSLKADRSVLQELAEAYICKNDYLSAIEIYNELLLNNPDDYNLLKQRAKVYYWSGDYYNANREFNKLTFIDPNDAEVKLFLGDTFFALSEYENARKVYEELLTISPTSHILQTRMSWFGGMGSSGFTSGTFPTYLLLSPEGNYFSDNFDYLYSTYGLKFDFGITDNIGLGVSGYGGVLASDSVTNNIKILKGNVYVKLSPVVSATAGLGATFFPGNVNRLIAEVSLRAEKKKRYTFLINFQSMDAAQLLYSPFLVDERLNANILLLQGDYLTRNDWKFSGVYAFTNISDDNNSNRLQLRLGKIFRKTFSLGYEYYYYNFKDQSPLYWSPRNYDSHSLWVDWIPADDDEAYTVIGGRVGYIPSENFTLREVYGLLRYRVTETFSLQGRLTFSTTIQSGRGYSSTSFGLAAFWNL
ncbi:MAG: tetratricopeptide repeat protein [Ignavibacteriaceae bacterium]